MNSTHRRAASAAAFLVLSFSGAPLRGQPQQPQRGGQPNADTPQILITTFHSNERLLGVQMAEEMRKRIASAFSAKELFVVTKVNINNTLVASGYPADSSLSAGDLMVLAKQVRGDLVIDGAIEKAGAGVKVDASILMRAGKETIAQPLPSITAKDVGDAAKQLEHAISEANKALPQYNICKNSALAAKYPEAAAAARASLAAYPNSNFARLCLLTVYGIQKAPPDSIIAVATAIRAVDPTSTMAVGNLAEAYAAKGDTAKAIEAYVAFHKLDPGNQAATDALIAILVASGATEKAIPIIDEMLANQPDDAKLLRTRWLIFINAGKYKEAIAAGEALVKADTAAANLDYFQRQIGLAQKDSNAAAIQQLASRAAQKFPRDATFQLIIARGLLSAGQLQPALAAARHLQELEPKNPAGYQIALAAQNQLHQADSAIATAQKAIAAGVAKTDLAELLAGVVSPALEKAQASKARADWQAMLTLSETVDGIAPSPRSSFYIGLAALQTAADIASDLQTLARSTKPAEKAQACAQAKDAEDLLTKVSIAMPKGGSVDKVAAAQILTGLPQLSEFFASVKKATCK